MMVGVPRLPYAAVPARIGSAGSAATARAERAYTTTLIGFKGVWGRASGRSFAAVGIRQFPWGAKKALTNVVSHV